MENSISCHIEKNKRNVIEYFYELEPKEWHTNIHKRAGTAQENIEDTLSSTSESSLLYVVMDGYYPAGYFVKYEDENGIALEGFHIGHRYRTEFYIKEFWGLVKEKMGASFVTAIYEKNKPAITHLKRQGFEMKDMIRIDHKTYYRLIYTV